MKLKISVFGLGYVGSVTAACLASQGHCVIGVDLNSTKVEQIQAGKTPIVEPGIQELVAQCRQDSRLEATTDPARAVLASDISLLCVGRPVCEMANLISGTWSLYVEALRKA